MEPSATLPSDSALQGLRVIDLSRVVSGPFCAQILADHGADVIKVEPPQGDESRAWGPPFVEQTSAYFMGVNRNKRGVVLDLSQPAEREMLLALLTDADVLIENFKIGTLERWGLGYEAVLSERFPKLIHCRISGFGADGPLGGLPGYDAAVQALSGIMSINGEANGGPLRTGMPVVDLVTGLNAALGVLLALQERARSGRGQFIDMALFDCAVSLLHPHMTNFLHSGVAPARSGNAHPNITPYDSFPTATVSIFLAVGNDGQYRKLCALIGRNDLATDPRFITNLERNRNRPLLRKALEEIFAKEDGREMADRLMRDGVPCAPVLTVPELVSHPHTQHRGMLVEIGAYRGAASPIKLGRSKAAYSLPPPSFGKDNAEVFGADRA